MSILMIFSGFTFAEEPQQSEWVNKGWSRIYKDTAFDSAKTLNRGECTALINSLLDLKDKSESSFKDVIADSPYINEISKAFKAGYIKGKGNGNFDANAEITKAEAYVMIARAFKLNLEQEAKTMLQFKDYKEVPAWAVGAVETISQKGYINDKNKIKPLERLLGSEAVALLEKIYSDNNTVEKKEDSAKNGANNPLNLLGAYAVSIENNKSVNLFKIEGDVQIDKDAVIKLEFDRGIVREYWENNQKQIILKAGGGREIASEVYRIDGVDSEKSFIFIKAAEELKSGKSYSIIIGKDLKANNGNTLGEDVTFTITIK